MIIGRRRFHIPPARAINRMGVVEPNVGLALQGPKYERVAYAVRPFYRRRCSFDRKFDHIANGGFKARV
jgi:hypothetical protein